MSISESACIGIAEQRLSRIEASCGINASIVPIVAHLRRDGLLMDVYCVIATRTSEIESRLPRPWASRKGGSGGFPAY
jgi:hypothetical protein